MFQLYVNQPLIEMARYYDACNHVLHTLMMKLSRSVFGTGELALRIPSLIGALLYFAAVYRLTRLLFRGWAQLLAVAAMVFHPLLLDFMVAARGYGLALALLMWSLYYAVCWLVKGYRASTLWKSGVCAGLAIAANLTVAVPAFATGLLLILMSLYRGRSAVREIFDGWAGPAFVPAFLLLLFPAMAVTGVEFYYGASSLADFARSFVVSAAKAPGSALFDGIHRLALPLTAVVSILFLVLTGLGLLLLYRWMRSRRNDYNAAPYILISGVAAVSLAVLILVHYALNVPYPFGRTGLYMIPLFTLTLLGFGKALTAANLRIRLGASGSVAAVLLTAVYVSQMDNRYFSVWRYDASTKSLLRHMQDDYYRSASERPAVLAATGVLEKSIEYYRHRRPMEWLKGPLLESIDSVQADYYLLTSDDASLAENLQLNIIQRDPLSGTILARRRR